MCLALIEPPRSHFPSSVLWLPAAPYYFTGVAEEYNHALHKRFAKQSRVSSEQKPTMFSGPCKRPVSPTSVLYQYKLFFASLGRTQG